MNAELKNTKTVSYPFLQGGGEMGSLTRNFNWVETPLGSPDTWPQSLRTAVSIVLSSSFPMLLWWGKELIQFYNDAFRPSLGTEGKHPSSLGQPAFGYWRENWHIIKPLIDKVFDKGESSYFEDLPIPNFRNGRIEEVFWTFSYSPLLDESGRPAAVLMTCFETTEKVSTIKALRQSEDRYRSLFDSMNQGFCVFEMLFDDNSNPVDYRFIETNPVFETQTGLKDAVGKTARELVPNLEPRWFELYGAVALTGKPARFVQGAEVMERWFDVFAFRMGDRKSRQVALLFSDISEQKRAEQAIRQSEQSLRTMIVQAPIAICILEGPSFVIEVANEKMMELWGKSFDAVMNKPLFAALPEVQGQGFEELMTKVYATGEGFSASEQPVTLRRNEILQTVFINFSYQPLYNASNKIDKIMATAIDVTEQVMSRHKIEDLVTQRTKELATANESLLSINKELQRSNHHLEEFAHAASHDLKEPIRKIQVFTSHLKGQMADRMNPQEKITLQRMESASERMGALVEDLLVYSHVSQRPHEMEPVNLTQKLQQVLEDLDLDIMEKEAVVTIAALPVVRGYGRQLQQLFQNLISNALKYSKANVPPAINVTSSKVTDSGHAYDLIEVADNGIGFEQEYAEKIFQMFTRLHGRQEYSGTGIGLSIVKKVVENHHGFIRAESNRDMGATFKVYLPI